MPSLLVAFALAAAALSPCPPEQTVKLDLPAFRKSVLKARAKPEEVRRLLRKLDLQLPAECPKGPTELLGLDVFPASLFGPGDRDRVVQARLQSSCGGESAGSVGLQVQVLRALGDGHFCRLGNDLSAGSEISTAPEGARPCEPGQGKPRPSRTLSFLEVVEQGRDVIAVEDVSQLCEEDRGEPARRLAYWRAEATSLREIFAVDTSGGGWGPHANDCQEDAAVDSLDDALPLRLRVRRTTGCVRNGRITLDTETRELWEWDGEVYGKTKEVSEPTWPF